MWISRSSLKLIKELGRVEWLEWNKLDKINYKFHATLVYGNTPESFKKIWRYVYDLKPSFNLIFNNIAIMKKDKGVWRIHKFYRFNKGIT